MKTKGKFTITLKTALIKMLQKGKKDPKNQKSPQSVIYKIASCAFSNRLKTALRYIIGRQQKAYTSSENIGSCLLNLLATMLHCNKSKLDGLLLLIDFKKAFDSIDHEYMYEI